MQKTAWQCPAFRRTMQREVARKSTQSVRKCAGRRVLLRKLYLLWRPHHYTNIRINLCLLDRASLWLLKNKRPTLCHLLFYFTSYVLNMFRTLIYPSSGACDYSVELPHWPYCSWFDVCWSFCVVRLEWYPCCSLQPLTRIPLQSNHAETPTHIEPRTIRPMW